MYSPDLGAQTHTRCLKSPNCGQSKNPILLDAVKDFAQTNCECSVLSDFMLPLSICSLSAAKRQARMADDF